ncbi:MAG: hypothetical protein ACYDAE_14485 [Steroidobacteraceae bacterium]
MSTKSASRAAPAASPSVPLPESAIRAAVDRTLVEVEPAEDRSNFDDLHQRLLKITSHALCADKVLSDLQDVPDGLQAACIVLHNAAMDLDGLCDEFDSWRANHVCRPKTAADREAVAAAYEAAMTPEERERYRASTAAVEPASVERRYPGCYPTAADFTDGALRHHLDTQQQLAYQLQALLEMASGPGIDVDPGVIALAARTAAEINDALDARTLARIAEEAA